MCVTDVAVPSVLVVQVVVIHVVHSVVDVLIRLWAGDCPRGSSAGLACILNALLDLLDTLWERERERHDDKEPYVYRLWTANTKGD